MNEKCERWKTVEQKTMNEQMFVSMYSHAFAVMHSFQTQPQIPLFTFS